MCIVAIGSTIAQPACNAPRHVHVTLKWAQSVINKLLRQPTLLMSNGPCYQQTSTTTNDVGDTAHRRKRGPQWRWTQIIGGKETELQTSRSVEKRNFTYPACVWRPRCGWSHRKFVDIFCTKKLEFWAIVRLCLRDPKFSGFRRTPTCDGLTDRQTHDDSKYCASIASRGKNTAKLFICCCHCSATNTIFAKNNWLLLSICFTLFVEPITYVFASTSFCYTWLTCSFAYHFFLFWFTTLFIHNSLTLLLHA